MFLKFLYPFEFYAKWLFRKLYICIYFIEYCFFLFLLRYICIYFLVVCNFLKGMLLVVPSYIIYAVSMYINATWDLHISYIGIYTYVRKPLYELSFLFICFFND